MKKVDKLVLLDLIGPFGNGLAMFLLLVFAAGYLPQATDLLVRGVPLPTVARLVLLKLPGVVTQTFPMAMLLAGLLAFGRLSTDREAVALFAAGISFPRILRAVIWAGAGVSVLAFVWNDILVPPATREFWNVQSRALRHIARTDQPLSFSNFYSDGEVEEFVNVDGGYDSATKTLRQVSIVKYSDNPRWKGRPDLTVYCMRAIAIDTAGLDWTYYDGEVRLPTYDPETGRTDSERIIDFVKLKTLPGDAAIGKPFGEIQNSAVTDPDRWSFLGLRHEIQAMRATGRLTDIRGMEVNLYGKVALPLASLIFGVVGAALGLNTTRGGSRSVGFGLAIFIVFLYWAFYHTMFVVGNKGGLPPMLASFLADIIGAGVGVVLAYRASR